MSRAAKKLDPNIKVTTAIQGELGSYSQQAVYSFFGRRTIKEVLPLPTLQRVFSVLTQRKGALDYAVVPIENSLAGSVGETIDLLISKDVRIVGETCIPINHCLIIHKDTTLGKIRKVMSHPQALAQCREYLDMNGKNWEQVSVYDTAGSVKMIKDQGLNDTAGIASELAAEIYGMKLAKKGIEDDDTNTTRFVVIEDARGPTETEPTGDDKTSAIFATKHEPGCLAKALSVLSSNGINLNRIESRPFRGRPWEYYFYVDFSGHMKEKKIKNAIEDLRGEVEELKILGSYKRRV
ncbi:MAG: prephenate dehydratase [Nitrososphaerota archaeon]|nr:prephenate dehydratase [Nitrososphaerota archaeon]MDG6921761.1 prephenate dehydratase [Nitrososphaerota archaeon]